MSTFTYTPSFTASESSQPRAHKFAAGDGFEQRIRFGLNTDPKEWDLQFNNRTNTERDAILSFFETQAGVTSFDWTTPRGIAGKYVCEQWSVEMVSYNFNNVRAKFRQVFEP
jgi:phage-related protein